MASLLTMARVIVLVLFMSFMTSWAMNYKDYENLLKNEEDPTLSASVPEEDGLSSEFRQEFMIRRSILRRRIVEKYHIPEFSAYGSPMHLNHHGKEEKNTVYPDNRWQTAESTDSEKNAETTRENLGSIQTLRGDSNMDYLDVSETNLPSFDELAAMDDDSFLGNSTLDIQFHIISGHELGYVGQQLTYHTGEMLRKLVGSNCVEIQRGTVSKYYQCIGCVIQNAMGCLLDMRQNKSGNVPSECTFDDLVEGDITMTLMQRQHQNCCPLTFEDNSLVPGFGTAYPDTLRCIEEVGCAGSSIYNDLMTECKGICDYNATLIGVSNGACSLAFAAGPRHSGDYISPVLLTLLIGVFSIITFFAE
jgi:hypothetical protein